MYMFWCKFRNSNNILNRNAIHLTIVEKTDQVPGVPAQSAVQVLTVDGHLQVPCNSPSLWFFISKLDVDWAAPQTEACPGQLSTIEDCFLQSKISGYPSKRKK